MTGYPNTFVVGAPKCGTTYLYEAFRSHPEIFVPRVKEPHYFAHDFDVSKFSPVYRERMEQLYLEWRTNPAAGAHCLYLKSEDDYLSLYQRVHEKRSVDMSTGYLFSEDAAHSIRQSCPDSKIIIMLRDPVQRAYSHYLMDVRNGLVRGSFREVLEEDTRAKERCWGQAHLYRELGLYSEGVRKFYECFGESHVFVGILEELIESPTSFVERLCSFLEVQSLAVEIPQGPVNEGSGVRSPLMYYARRLPYIEKVKALFPSRLKQSFRGMLSREAQPMLQQDRAWLADYYYEDVQELQQLLDRTLSAFWNVSRYET